MEYKVVTYDTPPEPPSKKPFKINKIVIAVMITSGILATSVIAFLAGKSYKQPERQNENQSVKEVVPPETDVPTGVTSALSPSLSPKTSPTSGVPAKTEVITSAKELDGFRSSDSSGNNTVEIKVGRNSDYVSRGFLSFDVSDIPADAKIINATLKIYQTKTTGNIAILGALKADHLTYGDSLDYTDYAMPALSSGFAEFKKSTSLNWKETDVTEKVRNDLSNNRGMSQFRIHFQNELAGGQGAGDFIYFESADNSGGSNNTPQLVIKYY